MSRSNTHHKAPQVVPDLEERTWLVAHLKGDGQAFAKLMHAYRKPVYSFLVRYGLDQTQRDDVFQEAFLKIHKAAHTYQSNKPLSPWIFTIVVNTVRNIQRKGQPLTLCIEEAAAVEDEAPSPENSAQLAETVGWLEQAMTELPPAQAEALTLSTVKGMKIKEIGAVLGLPLNTIKTQLRRARQNLLTSFQQQQTRRRSGVSHEKL